MGSGFQLSEVINCQARTVGLYVKLSHGIPVVGDCQGQRGGGWHIELSGDLACSQEVACE